MGDDGAVGGLNKIAGCDNPDRNADVIFIHGLDGDALSTWQAGGKEANFWPRWLGEDCPDVGVWSLGYAVNLSAWKGSSMPLADRATNALDQLELDGIGRRPVIFICHSLGGLLVKQMLRHANDFGNPDYRRIADQTRGIVFLSTPHSGSNIANWIKHLGTLLRTTVSVDELEAHHPRLRELNTWFRNHPKTPQIKTLVYCEKIKLKGLLVVDETSADPGIPGVIPVPMDDDHSTICKPKNRTAQVYRRAKRLVEEVLAWSSGPEDKTYATPQISASQSGELNNAKRTNGQNLSKQVSPKEWADDLGPVRGENENMEEIFISYSHDSENHRDRVLALSERMRQDGLETQLDQYVNGTPEKGWPRWMLDRLDEATHVLVICTETYYRRFRGHEKPGKGKGVDWEGALITQEIYDQRSRTCKFVPVLFPSEDLSHIPEPLRGHTYYVINSEDNYQALYDFLLGRAGAEPGPIGEKKAKPRPTAEPLSFESAPVADREEKKESNTDNENDSDAARLEQHLEFQNQIRTKVEEELAKETLKPLRDGFIEILFKNAGKDVSPSVSELVNELFKVDKAKGCADPEAMLNTLRRATEVCLERLEAVGERITETDIIWKTAKQILGWLTTLAVRSEKLADGDEGAVFDEIDLETLIGVEIYTARKKGIPATFRTDDTGDGSGNIQGGNQIDPGFFPETGWQVRDIVDQIHIIVWKAVFRNEPTGTLTEVDLKRLNKTLELHRTQRRNSVNYHLAIRKSSSHPLLIPDICNQVKINLPELTIVHMGSEGDSGQLLLIGEGELIALIDVFLKLIEAYQ